MYFHVVFYNFLNVKTAASFVHKLTDKIDRDLCTNETASLKYNRLDDDITTFSLKQCSLIK